MQFSPWNAYSDGGWTSQARNISSGLESIDPVMKHSTVLKSLAKSGLQTLSSHGRMPVDGGASKRLPPGVLPEVFATQWLRQRATAHAKRTYSTTDFKDGSYLQQLSSVCIPLALAFLHVQIRARGCGSSDDARRSCRSREGAPGSFRAPIAGRSTAASTQAIDEPRAQIAFSSMYSFCAVTVRVICQDARTSTEFTLVS
jgi:hypothetical protein